MSRIVRKQDYCLCENKGADQLRSNCEADQRLCFRNWIVQCLFYLNPKFQASSSFLSLYRPVCVGPSRKPRRPVFSRRGSFPDLIMLMFYIKMLYKLIYFKMSRDARKPVFGVSNQVRHKPACAVTDKG